MSPGVISVFWHPPPWDKCNGDIIGYVVRIIDLELLRMTEDPEIDVATTITKGGLKAAHPYNISVAAKAVEGYGTFSHPLSILTLPGGEYVYILLYKVS